jgi:hypothetical protein
MEKSAPICSRASDTPETDLFEFQYGAHLFAVHSEFARRIERERDALRDWIEQAAPILNQAACIVIDEAGVRLRELAGVRAILETCPVDFISENAERIAAAARQSNQPEAPPEVDPRHFVCRCVTRHFARDCREARFRELLEDVIWQHSDPRGAEYNECDKAPCAWCEEAKALIRHGHPDGVLSSANDQADTRHE